MKVCKACNKKKSLDEFYNHPHMTGGKDSKCKECAKERVKDNREKNSEYYKEFDRRRNSDPYRVASREVYALTDAGIASQKKSKKKWQDNNKIKKHASTTVGNAIRDKKLEKGPCEVCGGKKVHGHHDDYSKPLSVRWLCPIHHTEWHRENGQGKNG